MATSAKDLDSCYPGVSSAPPRMRLSVVQAIVVAVLLMGIMSFLDATGFAMDGSIRLRQQPEVSESELKSVFLFHLTKFVQWPGESDEATRPFVIGVIGREPFNGELASLLAGKEVSDDRPIVVRQFNAIGDIQPTDILFVGRDYSRFTGRILSNASASATLTVADYEGFAERGGMVEFRLVAGVTRLIINRDAATDANLVVSSKLLSIASRVIDRAASSR